jgi:hypothetical protein
VLLEDRQHRSANTGWLGWLPFKSAIIQQVWLVCIWIPQRNKTPAEFIWTDALSATDALSYKCDP